MPVGRALLAAALLAGCSPPPSAPQPVVLPSAEAASAAPSGVALPAERPCDPPPPIAAPPTPPPDRARLAAGLDPAVGDMVRSERSEIVARPTPFLAHGTIWDVEYFGHAHPSYFHLGEAEGIPTVDLSSSSAFVDFAKRAGITLDDDAKRSAYVKTFLSLDPRYLQLLEAPEDIHFTVERDIAKMNVPPDILDGIRPILLEEIQRRRQVEDHYAPAIKPLCLKEGFPSHGVIHAIKRQATLVRLHVTLGRRGEIEVREVVLAERVPVPAVYP